MALTSVGIGNFFDSLLKVFGPDVGLDPNTVTNLNRFLGLFAESSFEAKRCDIDSTQVSFSLVNDTGRERTFLADQVTPEERLLNAVREGRLKDLEVDALLEFAGGKLTREQLIGFTPKSGPPLGGILTLPQGDPGTGDQQPGDDKSEQPAGPLKTPGGELQLDDPATLPPDELVAPPFKNGCWHYTGTRVYFSGIGGVQASGQAAQFSIGAMISVKSKTGPEVRAGAKLTYSLTGDLLRRRVPDGKGGFNETDPLLTGRFTCPEDVCLYDWVQGTAILRGQLQIDFDAGVSNPLAGFEGQARIVLPIQLHAFRFRHFPGGQGVILGSAGSPGTGATAGSSKK